MTAWRSPLARSTMDIDLLGRTNNELEHIRTVIARVCENESESDGIAALPEPRAKVVGLICFRHGEYVLPINSKSDMCPHCIFEGEQAERRLLSLLPNTSRGN